MYYTKQKTANNKEFKNLGQERGACMFENAPMRLDVKEEVLILRSGIFRSVWSRHTQHHRHWAAAADNHPSK